jgi:HAD superfamily hydrolase (TIGR01509 family)
MAVKAVIFDMDGVLIASEGIWFETRVDFARAHGKDWKMDDQRACMGVNTIEWGHIMKQRLGLEMPVEDIMAEVKSRLIARLIEKLPVLPGAIEAVQAAAAAYPIALASGSPTEVILKVTQLMGIDKLFRTMVFGDDMARGKPAPDIYLETARRLAINPTDCAGVEDSGNGVRSLKAAGMKIIAVPSPGFPLSQELLALADRVLPSLTEFSAELVRTL